MKIGCSRIEIVVNKGSTQILTKISSWDNVKSISIVYKVLLNEIIEVCGCCKRL